MSVIKLTSQHIDQIKGLFTHKKYMGKDINDDAFKLESASINKITYDISDSKWITKINAHVRPLHA